MTKSASITIDSRKLTPAALVELEGVLYGTATNAPRMPLPDEIRAIVYQETLVDSTNSGTYTIQRNALIEDSTDPGTYTIINITQVSEDPADPGTYLLTGSTL